MIQFGLIITTDLSRYKINFDLPIRVCYSSMKLRLKYAIEHNFPESNLYVTSKLRALTLNFFRKLFRAPTFNGFDFPIH